MRAVRVKSFTGYEAWLRNMKPEKRLIDFNEVTEEALLFIRHDIDSKSIALSTTFGSGLPRVMGDRVQLQQVIINLLVNSVQAIAQSGQPTRRIDVQTSIDDRRFRRLFRF